jgi:hypothetical protein
MTNFKSTIPGYKNQIGQEVISKTGLASESFAGQRSTISVVHNAVIIMAPTGAIFIFGGARAMTVALKAKDFWWSGPRVFFPSKTSNLCGIL